MQKKILKIQLSVYRNILIFLGFLGIVFVAACGGNKHAEEQRKLDSIAKAKTDSIRLSDSIAREKIRLDSIATVKQDSIAKAKADSIKNIPQNQYIPPEHFLTKYGIRPDID